MKKKYIQKNRTDFWAIVEAPTPKSAPRNNISREFNGRLYIFTDKDKAKRECVGKEIVHRVSVNLIPNP